MLITAVQDGQMSAGYVTTVVLTGLIVVFIGLALLITFVYLIGKFFKLTGNKKKNREPVKSDINTAETPEPSQNPSEPLIEDGISEETVAVITSAVLAFSPDLKVTGIKKAAVKPKSSRRTAWGEKGVNESTSAF